MRWALAFCLVPRDVRTIRGRFAEAPGAFGGDDGDLAVGLQFAGYIFYLTECFIVLSYVSYKNT